LLNRAFKGTTDEELKSLIEDYGLTYDTESQIIAEKEANDIIEEVGLDKAFQAVQSGYINGAQATVIYAKMVDDIEAQLQKGNLSEEEQTRLKELQAYSVDILTVQRAMPVDLLLCLNACIINLYLLMIQW
jgi:hypothetical protein